MARSFPAVPMLWVMPDGTLSPEARRYLQSLHSQLGGGSPIDINALEATQREHQKAFDSEIYLVAGLP
jgi:hypothetical protein